MTKFNIFANGTFCGTWEAETAAEAIQIAADEVGTVDVGHDHASTQGMTAEKADLGWYSFRAYNSTTIYGFGSADEARRYSDHLNKGQEVNLYSEHEMSDIQAAEMKLEDRTDTFNLDDALLAIED